MENGQYVELPQCEPIQHAVDQEEGRPSGQLVRTCDEEEKAEPENDREHHVSACAYQQREPDGKIRRQSLPSQHDRGDKPKRVDRATAEHECRDYLFDGKHYSGD